MINHAGSVDFKPGIHLAGRGRARNRQSQVAGEIGHGLARDRAAAENLLEIGENDTVQHDVRCNVMACRRICGILPEAAAVQIGFPGKFDRKMVQRHPMAAEIEAAGRSQHRTFLPLAGNPAVLDDIIRLEDMSAGLHLIAIMASEIVA